MNGFSTTQKTVSTLLKIVVIVSAVVSTLISALSETEVFMGGKTVFMYFTIQSNIAVALISAIGFIFLFSGKKVSDVWYIIKFVGAISITLTGVVFCFALAPTLGKDSWNIQNILAHVVVPIAAVIDFFLVGINSSIRKRNTFWVIVPPLLYAIYASIGYVLDWQFAVGYNYPYFFLNWGSPAGAFGFTNELPFMGTAWWIIGLFIALIIAGFIYLAILDCLKRLFRKTTHR